MPKYLCSQLHYVNLSYNPLNTHLVIFILTLDKGIMRSLKCRKIISFVFTCLCRANILRESDKKLGWLLNSSQWYFKEYLRHLESDFYSRVGDIGDVHLIKQRCRKELTSIINKHKTCLSHKEVAKFYTTKIEEYILPSMNIMPKVHKLTTSACRETETLLKGRPIITARSWCTVEASQCLQTKLRGIIDDFKLLIQEKGTEFTILRDSKELINTIKNFKLDNEKSYNFITFDFKDLYTNILFDDTERSLTDLAGLLGIKDKNINLRAIV